jgi:hypothetical protein
VDRYYAKVEHHRNFADFIINNLDFATLNKNPELRKSVRVPLPNKVSRLCPSVNCGRLSCGSIPSYLTSGSTQPEWEEEGQPNSGPLCTFAEADQSGIFEKGRELLSPKEAVEMKEAGSYRF